MREAYLKKYRANFFIFGEFGIERWCYLQVQGDLRSRGHWREEVESVVTGTLWVTQYLKGL